MRLIDADALRKSMFSHYDCVNENTTKSTYKGDTLMDYEVVDLIEDCIDNAPTINPEDFRPKGKWIAKEIMVRSPLARNYYCSQCKYEPLETINFCHNCGAKMEG